MGESRFLTRRSLLRGVAGAAGTLPLTNVLALDGDVGTVNANGVRLRSGAGTSFSVVAVLQNGAKVTQQGSSFTEANGYDWIKVKVNTTGTIGWVARDFVSFTDVGEQPGESPSTTYPKGTTIVVTNGPLRVRRQPNGTVITPVATGTTGVSEGRIASAGGYTWLAVSIASVGEIGWVATDFIGKSGGGSTPGTGWPAGTAVYVDNSNLNLRNAASLTSSVLGIYTYGTNAEIISGPTAADGYNWYRVEILSNGATGYMIGEGLAKGSAGGSPTTDRIVVVDGPVNLRSNAGTSNSVVEVVKQGEGGDLWSTSMPTANGYTWVRIRVDSTQSIGWIATAFINFV
jgi:N-acetylmuramoyl-L-alanine amidase